MLYNIVMAHALPTQLPRRSITGFIDLFVWSKHEDTLSPEGVNVMADSYDAHTECEGPVW